MQQEQLLTLREAAKRFAASPWTIKRAIARSIAAKFMAFVSAAVDASAKKKFSGILGQ